MSRDHSVVSAKGIILWSIVGLNMLVLIAALIVSSWLLAGLSIIISLVILALYNARHVLPGARYIFGPHIVEQRQGYADKQTTFTGSQDPTTLAGHEWVTHSVYPASIANKDLRITVGNAQCSKPYSLSLFNIGTMRSGDLSADTIAALNRAAALGDFAHNTGEEPILPHHMNGGDLVWQVGKNYSGCADAHGKFSPGLFEMNAAHSKIKMIEIRLPLSTNHPAFRGPVEMIQFLGLLRQLSGGKPTGFNICIGNKHEFIDFCTAIQVTRIVPDFITIEGAERDATGLPAIHENIGVPFYDSLVFVRQTLEVFNMREHIRIIAAGSIVTAFDILKVVALGADACYNTGAIIHPLEHKDVAGANTPAFPAGLFPAKKRFKPSATADEKTTFTQFHSNTIAGVANMMEACGFSELKDIDPARFFRRIDPLRTRSFKEIYFDHVDERLKDGWFKACMLN